MAFKIRVNRDEFKTARKHLLDNLKEILLEVTRASRSTKERLRKRENKSF